MPNKFDDYQEEVIYPEDDAEFYELNELERRVACPCCCTVFNTLYRRKVYKSMVKALILLYRRSKAANPNSIGDFTKLEHFGLVRKMDEYWEVTDKGESFIKGTTPIPKYVYLRNNRNEGFSAEQVYIYEIE